MPKMESVKLKSSVIARPVTAVMASAKKIVTAEDLNSSRTIRADSWHKPIWDLYDIVPEFRYSVDWVGNILSKARLTIIKDGKEVTSKTDPAVQILALLGGGPDGQADLLRNIGIHLTATGDMYLISQEKDGEDEWLVAAACELSKGTAENSYVVDDTTYTNPLIIRMWRPHPVKPSRSNAPAHACLPILRELDGLTKRVDAEINSRLAGAGILLVPSEMSFAGKPGVNVDPANESVATQASAQEFVATLLQTMSLALSDREDPSALVPIILQADGEQIKNVRHLTFWSDLDENSGRLRSEAIGRLAMGMDMPPEVLTGTADMNHWGSWQVEEAAIKAHSEPLLAVVTSALATGYLRPLLIDGKMDPEEARRYQIGADTSAMRLRPDRSKEALELYNLGLISDEAVVRENGFADTDRPNDDQLKNWLLKKVASGSTTPELVAEALMALKVITSMPVTEAPPSQREIGTEAPSDPSLKGHPQRVPPDQADPVDSAAASILVFRALERAGNRLRSRMGTKIAGVSAADTYKYVTVSEEEVDGLLKDSWAACDVFAADMGVDAELLKKHLNLYTRRLILDKQAHSITAMRQFLNTPRLVA